MSLELGEVMTSYNVKSLFTCILPQGALEAVRSQLREDYSLGERTKLSVQNVCDPSTGVVSDVHVFCLKGVFYPQKHQGRLVRLSRQWCQTCMWRTSRGRHRCLSQVYLPRFGGATWWYICHHQGSDERNFP